MDPVKSSRRRSPRLDSYDYSTPGAYFVIQGVQERCCLFGKVSEDRVHLNDAGSMVQQIWEEMPEHYPGVQIDAYVVMPNHIHGIVILNVGAGPSACPESNHPNPIPRLQKAQPQGVAPTVMSLPDVVHRFKSLTTTRYRHDVRDHKWTPFPGKLWQSRYYDRVVRDNDALAEIRRYIIQNPARWSSRKNHPSNQTTGEPADEICKL